jgi:hypothetical protein
MLSFKGGLLLATGGLLLRGGDGLKGAFIGCLLLARGDLCRPGRDGLKGSRTRGLPLVACAGGGDLLLTLLRGKGEPLL